MSLSIQRCENIIIFKFPNDEDSHMAELLLNSEITTHSPDKKTIVTAYNTEEEAIAAFDKMKSVVNSFK